ncbi:MAG TPA: DUF1684 domain-containing protein [Bacteroidetes bacterium]|nr:DUF1684 domain-containing protein [Bacteroidota bacterium]
MKNLIFFFLLFSSCSVGVKQGSSYTQSIAHHREEYKKEFLADERSPLKKEDLKNLRFYKPDESYKVKCSFERTPDEQPFELPTYSGITKTYVKYGVLAFELQGKPQQLAVYRSLRLMLMPQYRDYLFLPFRDATNGETTYGGGRYLELKISEVESGSFYLDFNKCFNPWCAYSDGYNCPIPPVENTLEIAVLAGEKLYAGEKKHG